MRVFSFTRVIYDGNLTIDLVLFLIKNKPRRLFDFLALLPDVIKYLFRKIDDTQLANRFYRVLLNDITVSDLNLFKVNNMYKIDLDGYGLDKDSVILTGEPSFLIDLFINRTKYKVICTEYDLRERSIIGKLNMGKQKVENLKANGINHISVYYISSFKEKGVMKMSDLVIVYRNKDAIDFDYKYKMTPKDYLHHSLNNKNWILYVILAIVSMLVCMVIATFLTLIMPIIQAYLVSFFLWLCATYYLTVTYILKQPFNIDKVLGYILGVIPSVLLGALLVLIFGSLLHFPSFLVLLFSSLLSLPLLVFELRFYNFD